MIEGYCFAEKMHLCAMIKFIERAASFRTCLSADLCFQWLGVQRMLVCGPTKCRFHVTHRTLHPLRLSLPSILATASVAGLTFTPHFCHFAFVTVIRRCNL